MFTALFPIGSSFLELGTNSDFNIFDQTFIIIFLWKKKKKKKKKHEQWSTTLLVDNLS